MNTLINQQILDKAKRRVGFKIHFVIFLLLFPINWLVWYLTDTTYLWPIWPTIGWGFGVLFHWLGVYHSDKFFSVNKEYENLSKNKL
jgi:hypothetical protein